jgi:hypothetical protein
MFRAILSLAVVWSVWSVPAAERVFDFSPEKVNTSPPGFRSAVTGSGGPAEWRIILEEAPSLLPPVSPNAPVVAKRGVLAQLSRERIDERFPLLIFEEETFGDFALTTRFKIVDGTDEQMAGIAFRLQDEKNYYYIRASALGSSFYFFKIVDGIRSAPIGVKMEIARGVWHELTVECKGNEIRALFNGKEAIPALGDKSFSNGKIAFWTKSDSVSYFADTRIVYTPREKLAQILIRDTLKKYPRLKAVKIFASVEDGLEPRIIASSDATEIGRPAGKAELDVINRDVIYHGKGSDSVVVTLPLHDSNGDPVAAVSVVMKSFPGQTEKIAIVRATPIVKQMEPRIRTAKDLWQ